MKSKCHNFSVLITRYIDDELDVSEKNEVKIHLRECSECQETYEQETQVKKLLRERLPIVKAPAYLRSRIRRNLIRDGNRPGFWQLVHSLFLYRPVTSSLVMALIAFMVFLPTVQLLDNPFDVLEEQAKTAQLKGEIICLDCEFRSKSGVNPAHDPQVHRHGLKAEDESIWTFVQASSNNELLQDQKLLRKKALVSGILFRKSQYIYVQEYKLL